MVTRGAQKYEENNRHTSVSASSSGSLIVLIYDRIFDHLKVGKNALENNKYGIESFTKAHDLIQQGLLACLDYKDGGEVAQNLKAIYEWSLKQIIAGRAAKSPEKIQEVIDVLQPLYDGWVALAPKESIALLSGDEYAERGITA